MEKGDKEKKGKKKKVGAAAKSSKKRKESLELVPEVGQVDWLPTEEDLGESGLSSDPEDLEEEKEDEANDDTEKSHHNVLLKSMENFGKSMVNFTKVLGSLNRQQRKLMEQVNELKQRDGASGSGTGESGDKATLQVVPGDQVPDKVKQSIWEDKYIDFHDLLANHKEDEEFSLKLNKQGSLVLEAKEKGELTIKEWRKAFNLFQAAYLQKFKPEVCGMVDLQVAIQDLLSYESLVMRMEEQGLDWYFYDRMFRKNREKNRCRFSIKDNDLYNEATTRSIKLLESKQLSSQEKFRSGEGNPRFRSFQPGERVPIGYCFKFHKGLERCEKGADCPFRHWCPVCKQAHPAYKCRVDGWRHKDLEPPRRDLQSRGARFGGADYRDRAPYPRQGRTFRRNVR